MSSSVPIQAGVLVGGTSQRMGTCKALLAWNGGTMVERVVRAAQTVAGECVLLGTLETVPSALTGIPILADAHPRIGPLGGLHTLLSNSHIAWNLLLACDIPNVSTSAINGLVERIGDNSGGPQGIKSVAYIMGGRVQSCCALFHRSLLPDVERGIADGHYALQDLIRSHAHELVDGRMHAGALRNVNTPDDYSESLGCSVGD